MQHNSVRQCALFAHNPDLNPGFEHVTLLPSPPLEENSSDSWGPLLWTKLLGSKQDTVEMSLGVQERKSKK